ncbi:SAM-dependent methyltransferase [Kitasatospora viridis]|uniref:S-adenosyl methyltransferase n=1 Tax=Kitasatospora viridis TaxID=281105 RepID=A0A561TTF9_9ACTN|nr:SAM-dependent methyltransferase [Kitasatospora viridis]TWF90390.1 S-adenosyl methyltransferase [Kitasatospora viridis]
MSGNENDWMGTFRSVEEQRTTLQTDRPHPARMYDYYLGR